MNWGQMYGKGYLQKLYAHTWPTAYELNQMSKNEWQEISRFEKLCWAWAKLNNYALKTARDNPNIMVVRFEDIFISKDKDHNFENLMVFLSPILDEKLDFTGQVNEMLGQRIHQSTGDFPEWNNWSEQHKTIFDYHCENLRRDLGYI